MLHNGSPGHGESGAATTAHHALDRSFRLGETGGRVTKTLLSNGLGSCTAWTPSCPVPNTWHANSEIAGAQKHLYAASLPWTNKLDVMQEFLENDACPGITIVFFFCSDKNGPADSTYADKKEICIRRSFPGAQASDRGMVAIAVPSLMVCLVQPKGKCNSLFKRAYRRLSSGLSWILRELRP